MKITINKRINKISHMQMVRVEQYIAYKVDGVIAPYKKIRKEFVDSNVTSLHLSKHREK